MKTSRSVRQQRVPPRAFVGGAAPLEEDVLSLLDVMQILGLSHESVYKRVRAGSLSKPEKYAGRSYWKATDVQKYINTIEGPHGKA